MGEREPIANQVVVANTVSRSQKPDDYPERFPVPDKFIEWRIEYPEYSPTLHDVPRAETPKAKAGDYGDPKNPNSVDWSKRQAFGGEIGLDEAGYPQNPLGRTGIAGRGKLNQWGPTLAADPIVTRDGRNGQLELLIVTRADNGLSALPGGKLEVNETNEPIEKPENAAGRELLEEAGIIADFANARLIYFGPVDDERNTDNAWMETTAFHVHLSGQEALQNPKPQESDVEFAEWSAITPELIGSLNANIGQIVKLALPRET